MQDAITPSGYTHVTLSQINGGYGVYMLESRTGPLMLLLMFFPD